MGRHEPLTSLALGRSPYDDVVEGEGEADFREPAKQYDEHGRVVNEESKQRNKAIIRAHNEVMLVIGVAEPENGGPAADSTRLHREYENAVGRHFIRLGRILTVAGVWGVQSIRQRILVYKETARLPFLDMMLREGRTHTLPKLLFAGMPSFFSAWSLQWWARAAAVARNHAWLRALITYVKFHLQVFVAMQRLDLIPGSRWLPNPSFFIPFSRSSPFIAPPSLGSPGAETAFQWAAKLGMGLAPYAGYYLIGRAWDILSRSIRPQFHANLPQPGLTLSTSLRGLGPVNTAHMQTFPDSPTLGAADREIRHSQSPEMAQFGPLATHGEVIDDVLPTGTVHGESLLLSRGGDGYATDDEDPETVHPPLISFDVDTSEVAEPPTGIWSAELRPTNSDGSGAQHKEAPRYVVNTLTSLPSLLAGDVLTNSVLHTLLTPFNIVVFRAMARAFSSKFGLPVAHMFEVSLLSSSGTQMFISVAQVEVLKFIVSFGVWAFITRVSQRFHVTDEEWKEYRLGQAAETQESQESQEAHIGVVYTAARP
ncbi:hypothetical protein GGR50DRAFT_690873 [Xylaria sp. CBS 124048]|nr:hypothetical protein GGR50DRAFT_690873 [Xylaria sp. CBS 124048]